MLVIILFHNALEISNINIIMTSEDSIKMVIIIDLVLATGAYETVKSTPSSMYDPSAQVLE